MKKPSTKSKETKTYKLPKDTPTVPDQQFIKQNEWKDAGVVRFKHMANLGDIVASLAGVKKFYEITGRKVTYCQVQDALAAYYQSAVHPTVDAEGRYVTINQAMFDMVKPLVEAQPYIEKFEKYAGQAITVDLDVIRGKTNVNMPHGMLAAWPFFAYPDLACDLSKQWLFLPKPSHPIQKKVKGKILLNFTERYRNHLIDYHFLQKHVPDLAFVGTEREHWLFCQNFGLNVPKIEVKDFLELAYVIAGCRFTLSNQSFTWNIAEAMKHPRLLEVCSFADNCQPFVGENSFGFFYQAALEYYFTRMNNSIT